MNAIAAKKIREKFQACLVVYDVPSNLKLANPSDKFKRNGVRINYSCWIVPLVNIPRLGISDMKRDGIDVEVVRFDEGETENIIRLADQALRKELSRIRKAVSVTVAKAAKKYAEASKERSDSKYATAYSYHRINERRIKDAIASAKEAAAVFDLTGDLNSLFDAVHKSIVAMDSSSNFAQEKAASAIGRGSK